MVQLTMDDITVTRDPNNLESEGEVSENPNMITVTIIYNHQVTFPLVKPMTGTDNIKLTASVTNTILRPTCVTP